MVHFNKADTRVKRTMYRSLICVLRKILNCELFWVDVALAVRTSWYVVIAGLWLTDSAWQQRDPYFDSLGGVEIDWLSPCHPCLLPNCTPASSNHPKTIVTVH